MIEIRLPQGYYSSSGTVLARRDAVGEGYSLLLFLRGLGPVWVGAPSSGSRSRFGGGTEPLTWGEFSLYQSPLRLYVKGIEIREDFLCVRSSPEKLLCAMRLYRLTAKEAPVGGENDLLLKALWSSMLQLKEGAPCGAVEFRFMWKMLNVMGAAPTPELCVNCGMKLDGGGVFTEGGFLCSRCAVESHGEVLSGDELKLIRASISLAHDKFIAWAKTQDGKNMIYSKCMKILSPYFKNLR